MSLISGFVEERVLVLLSFIWNFNPLSGLPRLADFYLCYFFINIIIIYDFFLLILSLSTIIVLVVCHGLPRRTQANFYNKYSITMAEKVFLAIDQLHSALTMSIFMGFSGFKSPKCDKA